MHLIHKSFCEIKLLIAQAKHDSITERQWIIIAVVSFLLLKSFYFLMMWRRRNKIQKKNYESIIENIKSNSLLNKLLNDTGESEIPFKTVISDDTEKKILLKLEEFEKSDLFLKKDITISFLADQFCTNTKYISEIIKNHKKQNFNSYINGLRINYIVSKLYNDPVYRGYKISYLAEECGFASYQVFNLAFKKTVGITPLYFIMQLQDDLKSVQNTDLTEKTKVMEN